MMKYIFILFLGLSFTMTPCIAQESDTILPNPVQEQRARTLTRQLRCLVCQSESIDESHAPLAKDLRQFVRTRISQGETDAQIINELRDRYGDFILLSPPFSMSTFLLWILPEALLLLGILVLWQKFRRNRI